MNKYDEKTATPYATVGNELHPIKTDKDGNNPVDAFGMVTPNGTKLEDIFSAFMTQTLANKAGREHVETLDAMLNTGEASDIFHIYHCPKGCKNAVEEGTLAVSITRKVMKERVALAKEIDEILAREDAQYQMKVWLVRTLPKGKGEKTSEKATVAVF